MIPSLRIVCVDRQTGPIQVSGFWPFKGQRQMILNCAPDRFRNALVHYRAGAVIQNAFSFLTDDEREFLMTGLYPHEWQDIFSSEKGEPA